MSSSRAAPVDNDQEPVEEEVIVPKKYKPLDETAQPAEAEEPQEENKCYWGPAHMEECDTEEYCKKRMPDDSQESGEDEAEEAPIDAWDMKQAERPEDPEECQKGPEYFCSTPELIEKCKVKNICDNPDGRKL
ncbi:balbiani ring protein 6-like [Nasonia vitripennis]|uniref:Uncharacterized protein n=1 Tax=Nasonia vitripennis TaxID=7425 RepID=A0A7M7Q0S7_NASVI|nr:balbiani ring protein 6-like [Nasonia vitripennis]